MLSIHKLSRMALAAGLLLVAQAWSGQMSEAQAKGHQHGRGRGQQQVQRKVVVKETTVIRQQPVYYPGQRQGYPGYPQGHGQQPVYRQGYPQRPVYTGYGWGNRPQWRRPQQRQGNTGYINVQIGLPIQLGWPLQ